VLAWADLVLAFSAESKNFKGFRQILPPRHKTVIF
jgi:hypothetical protein